MAARVDSLRIGTLQVVLKTVERCNLACDYCYFFEGGDASFERRPPIVSRETISEVASFLRQGCADLEIPNLNIVFHGGEPMLQKPREFSWMCRALRRLCETEATKLSLSMQTNGTIATHEWKKVLREHDVRLSVSIDPDRAIHDRHRKDHRGRGTYDLIASNVPALQDLGATGVLSVLAPSIDYRAVVTRFVDDLGFSDVGFLLPDCNRDTGIPGDVTAADFGRALCQIFDVALERPDVRVREVEKILRMFNVIGHVTDAKPQHGISGERPATRFVGNQVIVVRSDGEVDIDDTYVPAEGWRGRFESVPVAKTTLRDWLNGPQYVELDSVYSTTPTECVDCTWRAICNGGDIENRYSLARGFDNASVYCDGLKLFYSHVIQRLYEDGYPKDGILDRLTVEASKRMKVYAG